MTANLPLRPVQSGLGSSGYEAIPLSALWLAAVGPGGMTARMTTRASNDSWVGCGGAGSNVKFLNPTHRPRPRQAKPEAAKSIVVGDNA
jgi:hypothetical protein